MQNIKVGDDYRVMTSKPVKDLCFDFDLMLHQRGQLSNQQVYMYKKLSKIFKNEFILTILTVNLK